ncbi:MAG: hypothetical protein V4635_04845 [Bacteroidota bacterium]
MKFKLRILLSIGPIFFLFSCSRRGCTDTVAENYEPRAKVNSSCYYGSKAIIWYHDMASVHGATKLFYYVDGEFNGESDRSLDFYRRSYAPGSYEVQTGNTLRVNLGQEKVKTCLVLIKDEYDNVVWQKYVEFKARTTFPLEI